MIPTSILFLQRSSPALHSLVDGREDLLHSWTDQYQLQSLSRNDLPAIGAKRALQHLRLRAILRGVRSGRHASKSDCLHRRNGGERSATLPLALGPIKQCKTSSCGTPKSSDTRSVRSLSTHSCFTCLEEVLHLSHNGMIHGLLKLRDW